ncbi:hypothetical protein CRYUN_Cryun02cG0023700 [Craigia yunnanensis]
MMSQRSRGACSTLRISRISEASRETDPEPPALPLQNSEPEPESDSSSTSSVFFIISLSLARDGDQALAAEFPRDFLGILLPEKPNKYYFILRGHKIVLEADSFIQLMMEKLQSYKSWVALNFEGYQLGDFQLRVGKVVPTHSENFRGIVMEILYYSCLILLKHFFGMLM